MKKTLCFVLLAQLSVSCSLFRTPARETASTAPTSMTARESYRPKALRYDNATLNDLLNTARSYGGTGYQYGGRTSEGLDCSALVQTAFKQIGVKLPRTAAQQAETGQAVSQDEIRPGDIVFFVLNGKNIDHVGIVTISQQNKIMFIHASGSRGVIEDDLEHTYWKSHFAKATRHPL